MLEQVPREAPECPECGMSVANVQGVDACPECEWIAHR